MTPGRIACLRSGGQTGADRAALDAGVECGVAVAGWCPAGGWAEDLPEPPGLLARYPRLRPTPSADPAVRTAWNVRDADATLVISLSSASPSAGTELTVAAARGLSRPLLVTDGTDVASVLDFLDAVGRGLTVNVAGPRESEAPGTYARTLALLRDVLRRRD